MRITEASLTARSLHENQALTTNPTMTNDSSIAPLSQGPDWEHSLRWQDLDEDEREMILSSLAEDGWEMFEVVHARYWREGDRLFIRDVCGGVQ